MPTPEIGRVETGPRNGRAVRLTPGERRLTLSRGDSLQLGLFGLAAVLVWQLSDILLLLFLAVLLGLVLRGMADALAVRLKAPPQLMLAVVALCLATIVIVIAYWVGPAVYNQANDLVSRLMTYLQMLRAHYGHSPIGDAVKAQLSTAQSLAGGVMGHAFTVLSSTLGMLASLFALIIVGLYLAIAPGIYLNGAIRLVPPRYRLLARSVLEEIGRNLRLWMLGQLVDMVTVGALSAIGLYLLGVPVPFALATLAGLLTIVPYFGALAAGIPGVLVALTVNWATALWTVGIFTFCHIIEGYVVAPLVQRHMVRLPPALSILSMSIAAVLFGPLGIVAGTPLAVAAQVAVKRIYVEYVLGDVSESEPP